MNYSAVTVNNAFNNGMLEEMVERAEQKHAAQFAKLLEMIDASHEKNDEFVGAIFITGPSASGKTTFSARLSSLLEADGYSAPVISIDNYYKDRAEIHRHEIEIGMFSSDATEFDYESVEAFDVKFFREQMSTFLKGDKISLPVYDFACGIRRKSSRTLTRKNNTLLVIEGIQAMNPLFGEGLAFSEEFNIYICPFDGFSSPDGEIIDTKQLRFMRRSIRDIIARQSPISRNLDMWGAVRAGEEKYIKPMKRSADFLFNSALEYEILFHRSRMEQILQGVSESDVKRIGEIVNLNALFSFEPCPDIPVPEQSIFKEFYVG